MERKGGGGVEYLLLLATTLLSSTKGPLTLSQLTGFVNEVHIRMMPRHQLSDFSNKDLSDTEGSLGQGEGWNKNRNICSPQRPSSTPSTLHPSVLFPVWSLSLA
ncbi:hypothetical protein CEXT_524591 [Caerostris extrusa]|uniref:Uncharacterized protein n=1 Tax=Caerostris extrusa TaxID=172846 RepID=A0AAV4STS8_CAEEX|nr:hypothetical protein CEXT_524591 [Caerostris extrusa]